MTATDFENYLMEGKWDFKGQTFEHKLNLDRLIVAKPNTLRFFKCTFNKKLNIINLHLENLHVNFFDCTFLEDVDIEDCSFSQMKFNNLKSITNITISNIKTNLLQFSSGNILIGDIFISDTVIKHYLDCSRLCLQGEFTADVNRFKSNETNSLISSTFRKSEFKVIKLYGALGNVSFEDVTINDSAHFLDVTFAESYFNRSKFGHKSRFNSCIFQSKVSFKDCGTSQTEVSFEICSFRGQTFFTKGNYNKFLISDTVFEDRTSFEHLEVNFLELYLTVFQKITFFNEIKIHQLLKSENKILTSTEAKNWRNTLRLIKQELLKADNKIDYNRFRSYELVAYYRELKWDWKDGRDKFILGATWLVTGFDHSWRRALAFTLIAGMAIYCLFYASENYYNQLSFSETKAFLSGYFRFLLVTDFYNPLISDKRAYIDNSNTVGWLIFIFGKIVIAFGMYELIQAFRKFKA